MDEYLKSGLVKKMEEGLVVDEHMKGILDEFVAFLKRKDLLPEHDPFLMANKELAQSDGGN